jgi:hypothetical protein
MANSARFVSSEDLIVMPFKCRIDVQNYCALAPVEPFEENYAEPKAYIDGVWCVIKIDGKYRWYGDPSNPDNPQHPDED